MEVHNVDLTIITVSDEQYLKQIFSGTVGVQMLGSHR